MMIGKISAEGSHSVTGTLSAQPVGMETSSSPIDFNRLLRAPEIKSGFGAKDPLSGVLSAGMLSEGVLSEGMLSEGIGASFGDEIAGETEIANGLASGDAEFGQLADPLAGQPGDLEPDDLESGILDILSFVATPLGKEQVSAPLTTELKRSDGRATGLEADGDPGALSKRENAATPPAMAAMAAGTHQTKVVPGSAEVAPDHSAASSGTKPETMAAISDSLKTGQDSGRTMALQSETQGVSDKTEPGQRTIDADKGAQPGLAPAGTAAAAMMKDARLGTKSLPTPSNVKSAQENPSSLAQSSGADAKITKFDLSNPSATPFDGAKIKDSLQALKSDTIAPSIKAGGMGEAAPIISPLNISASADGAQRAASFDWNAPQFAQRLAREISDLTATGDTKKFEINPRNLGRLEISMITRGANEIIQIKTDSDIAREVIVQHNQVVQDMLRAQGRSDLTVRVDVKENGFASQNNGQNNGENAGENAQLSQDGSQQMRDERRSSVSNSDANGASPTADSNAKPHSGPGADSGRYA